MQFRQTFCKHAAKSRKIAQDGPGQRTRNVKQGCKSTPWHLATVRRAISLLVTWYEIEEQTTPPSDSTLVRALHRLISLFGVIVYVVENAHFRIRTNPTKSRFFCVHWEVVNQSKFTHFSYSCKVVLKSEHTIVMSRSRMTYFDHIKRAIPL